MCSGIPGRGTSDTNELTASKGALRLEFAVTRSSSTSVRECVFSAGMHRSEMNPSKASLTQEQKSPKVRTLSLFLRSLLRLGCVQYAQGVDQGGAGVHCDGDT
jgi:hypothetical protein